jgi:conjugal transfer pilus assembly protein TraW
MIKSLAVRTRCFSVAFIAALTVAPSQAQQSPLTEEDMQIVRQSRELAEKARAVDMPEWLGTNNEEFNQAHVEAKELVKQLQQSNPTMRRMSDIQNEKRRFSNHKIIVFASRSLGKQGLESLLDSVSGKQDVLVAFRGIPENANLGDALLELQQLAAERDPVPNIVLNPVLFQEYGVTAVPTIIVREDQKPLPGELPKELARVSGLSDPTWLLRQMEAGDTGDFGARGPVADISEPDLIELMQKRFANINWEEKKKRAVNNFWEKQRFRELPEARKARVRMIDPSVYITSDITAPDGTVIARKGEVIDPLNDPKRRVPFTQAVVVFDPLDEDQVQRVKADLPRINRIPGVSRVTYIATRMNREEGWDSYKKITDIFDAPVFLLTPDVAQRFELEYVPSIITAQKGKFIVEELPETRAEP